MITRLSIELTNKCSKGCSFCYNASNSAGTTHWTASDVIELVEDCARHGLEAVSFGGGEPLEFEPLGEVLKATQGLLFRSLTTHGLLLDDARMDLLVQMKVDKVHVSIHHPANVREVDRVIRQVDALAERGITSGINFLVARSQLRASKIAAKSIRDAGFGPERVVYLPMRMHDSPSPMEMAEVAGGVTFQSMSCLMACGKSPRFCAVGWDRRVAWCSYTLERRLLKELTYAGLQRALEGLPLVWCGAPVGEMHG